VTVIILRKFKKSLGGYVSKYLINPSYGVFVGNISSRIREIMWNKILENIGNGEAILIYNQNGYKVLTNTDNFVDIDGILLPFKKW
jgi:CRISPR-associated protein Cas2